MPTATGVGVGLLVLGSVVLAPAGPPPIAQRDGLAAVVSGRVRAAGGPVPGATVRVQTTARRVAADGEGRFRLPLAGLGDGPFQLTAWAEGYYCGGPVAVRAGQEGVELRLDPLPAGDNPSYAWVPSFAGPGGEEVHGCAECHSREGTDLDVMLPFDQWRLDAHSQAASNPRFLTLYAGTDVDGRPSPPTRWADDPDYGRFPLPPDATGPYHGPGYRLDFPDTAGSCAACHTPVAAVAAPYDTDPTAVTGVAAEGVACDFCHKVWAVRLDPATGLPAPGLPGVLSFELKRPPADRQLFIGPFDDVAPGDDTFSPLQRQSQLCAPCHFGVFWDTVVYNSFGEWLASPYADPETGRTCQDCHMPRPGAEHFARPDHGGLARDPATIRSHRMPGAADRELLQNAVTMLARGRRDAGRVFVEVSITNDRTGHHVPTDSPLRHLILIVRATDPRGQKLELLDGPRIPEYGGVGDPGAGHYGGQPGKAFAKILEEAWTGIAPTAAYWAPTRVVSDNRLAAFATDVSHYAFAAPVGQQVEVEVTLLFRRAFIELMEQKGWDVPDVVMSRRNLLL